MELAEVLKVLWSRKPIVLAIVALAVLAGVAAKLSSRSAPKGAATVQILVDSPSSALANLVQNTTPLTARAAVLAQVMASQAVLEEIGKASGIPADRITAEGPYSGSGEKLDVVTPSEARGNQLLAQNASYKLTYLAQENEPVITTSVQAPTAADAARLAAGVYPGVSAYIAGLQKTMNTPSAQRVTIRQLGPPQSGTVGAGSGSTVAAAAGLGVLLLGLLALVGIEGARRRAREPEHLARGLALDLDRAALAAGFERVGSGNALHVANPARTARDRWGRIEDRVEGDRPEPASAAAGRERD